MFLRGLRRLDPALPWQATVVSARGPSSSTPLRNELRERITLRGGRRAGGARTRRRRRRSRATARRQRPGSRCARWPPGRCRWRRRSARTASCSATASAGCCSWKATARVSPSSSTACSATAALRERLHAAADPLRDRLTWDRVADELRGDLPLGGRTAPSGDRQRRAAPAPWQAAADRRRPAHAHRPLGRLRDAGRGAAGNRARNRDSARSPSPTTTRSQARSTPPRRPPASA